MAQSKEIGIIIGNSDGGNIRKDLDVLTTASIKELEDQIEKLSQTFRDFHTSSSTYLQELRALRMSIVQEVATSKTALADLRTFFLSKDHELEIARLKDFIDLCERLERLTKNGTLDKVADVMLKLEGA